MLVIFLAITSIGLPSALARPRDGGGGSGGTSPLTKAGRGVLQAAACPFRLGAGIIEGQQVTCGYLTVPENRLADRGQDIKLAVAIFRSPRYMNTRDPAPVLRLDGGPGATSLNSIASFVTAQNYRSMIFNHNVIMFDQRGAGYSIPSLDCSEITVTALVASYEQEARACYNRLVASGIDLNGFNTIQNAADVADLIHALGYQQMTLYGVSYGTRLALTVLRLYPSVVRAAVLDSVYPPTHTSFNLPGGAQRAFNVLFQGCATNVTCNTKYPNLSTVLYDLVDHLNATPTRITFLDPQTGMLQNIILSGDELVYSLFSSLYTTAFIPLLPQAIYQIKAQVVNSGVAASVPIPMSDAITSTQSMGTFFSTECSEDYPFLTRQDLIDEQREAEPQVARPMGTIGQRWYNICQFWRVQTVPLAQKQAVFSNLPALVLAGEYDPITPPANGLEVVQHLSRSFYFLFPGLGHGVLYSAVCPNLIISAFEDNPEQRPSDACIDQMTEPAFS